MPFTHEGRDTPLAVAFNQAIARIRALCADRERDPSVLGGVVIDGEENLLPLSGLDLDAQEAWGYLRSHAETDAWLLTQMHQPVELIASMPKDDPMTAAMREGVRQFNGETAQVISGTILRAFIAGELHGRAQALADRQATERLELEETHWREELEAEGITSRNDFRSLVDFARAMGWRQADQERFLSCVDCGWAYPIDTTPAGERCGQCGGELAVRRMPDAGEQDGNG